jgi:hypothetical protein
MQEQNFEKQVQFKLDELSLTPSAPVWQKVEKEIRQKKKRRRMVIFWLFPLLLVGSGTYWGLTTMGVSKEKQSAAFSTRPTSPTEEVSSSTSKVNRPMVEPTIETVVTDTTTLTTTLQATSKKTSNNVIINGLTEGTAVINRQTPNYKKSNTNTVQGNTLDFQNKQSFVKTRKTKKQPVTMPDAAPSELTNHTIDQRDIVSSEKPSEIKLGKDTASGVEGEKVPELVKTEPKVLIDSSQIAKKKQEQSPKWSWRAEAGYGITSLQTELLSKSSRIPQSNSVPLSGSGFPGPAAPITAAPSRVENGRAFHVNIGVSRKINNRLAATAGLQYNYLTTKNNVGQTVVKDTIVVVTNGSSTGLGNSSSTVINTYYRNTLSGQTQKHTNNYHFIELPLGIEWQVRKNLPVKWQTGISISYLLASNALVYDPNAGIYYQNNELLNRTQVQFFSGLSYQLWKHKKLGVHIGPYLQYGLTGLQKETSSYHLLSTGIKTQVSF